MRALTLSAHGGVEQLEYREDLATPTIASPTDALVRIHAAALNRLDLWVLGGLPNVSITPPWIVGSDAAGVVEAVGSAVTGVRPGARVLINPGINCGTCEYCRDGDDPLCLTYRILGEHVPGTMAERVVVPAANLRPVPDGVSFVQAAAFPLATLTAWRMVVTRANVQAGEDVLIWGIGGGVAQQALQICRFLGARTWVTSGSAEKLERARVLGADVYLDHSTMDVGREVRQRTGKRGVNVVVDSVGERTWKQSLGALGKRGRLVTCGGTSGPNVETDIRRLFWNQWTIMGSTMGTQREFSTITDHLHAGRFMPVVDSTFPLARGREAYERLASGQQFGKVVVEIG
ncbi:MAG: zinc-binding dehydrogenase [Gemmatimonadaceae bacterium]|nr:zinc-binding dehydrogenase [Gemmatimonadaceae bacterium]